MEKNIQFFADVNEVGEIVNAQMGVNIVMTDPTFPFVFMVDADTAGRIAENLANFKVEIQSFKPQLIEKEVLPK